MSSPSWLYGPVTNDYYYKWSRRIWKDIVFVYWFVRRPKIILKHLLVPNGNVYRRNGYANDIDQWTLNTYADTFTSSKLFFAVSTQIIITHKTKSILFFDSILQHAIHIYYRIYCFERIIIIIIYVLTRFMQFNEDNYFFCF